MDIAALSIPLSISNVTSDVSMAVLKKSMESLEQTGDGMLKILEASVTPYLGQNVDYSV